MSKKFTQSKVLAVNAVAAGLIALEASTGMIQPYLPVNFYAAMTFILPIINAILRVFTNQAVTLGGGEND